MLATLAALSLIAAAPQPGDGPPFRGRPMTLAVDDVDVRTVMTAIATASHLNLLVAADVDAKTKVHATDAPWDNVLFDVVKDTNLKLYRQGSFVIVGKMGDERLAAWAKAKPAKKETPMRLRIVDVELADALRLLEPEKQVATVEAESAARFTAYLQACADVARDALVAAAHLPVKITATARTPVQCDAPLAASTSIDKLVLVGVASRVNGRALVKDGDKTVLLAPNDCVGLEKRRVKMVGNDFVLFAKEGEHPEQRVFLVGR